MTERILSTQMMQDLQTVLDEFESEHGRKPYILDLVGVALPDQVTFRPMTKALHYFEETADIALCDPLHNPEIIKPIVTSALVTLSDNHIEVDWLDDEDLSATNIDSPHWADKVTVPNGQRVLFVAPSLPEYDRESGSRRLYHLVELLLTHGYEVTYTTDNFKNGERYVNYLNERGVDVYSISKDIGRLVMEKYDIAIIAFWSLARGLIPHIRHHAPETQIIVDSIDLHFLRESRSMFMEHGRLQKSYGEQVAAELNAYLQADMVLTVSPNEATFINNMVGDQNKAFSLPDLESLRLSPFTQEERRGILFIGNFRHLPNIDAIKYFMNDIVPLLDPALLEENPIYVVGNQPTQEVQKVVSGWHNVHLVGWVPSVIPYYERAKITAAPLRVGAGTKRKLLQAMMIGTPSVTTPIGAEGFGLEHNHQILIAEDAEQFATEMTRLLTDSDLWEQLLENGRNHIMSTHSYEAVLSQFETMLKKLDYHRKTVETPHG